MMNSKVVVLTSLYLLLSVLSIAQQAKILTNQVGYETDAAKRAVIMTQHKDDISAFRLINETGTTVFTGKPVFTGGVDKWKNWLFYSIDFSAIKAKGTYTLQITDKGAAITSYPFIIGTNVLEQYTLSDILYYLKGQRSSGLFDEADHHLRFEGQNDTATVDAHGGWYDATGDYGIHLSHLSFSTYFNPQQVSLTPWVLLKTYQLLSARTGTDFRQYKRRVLDEAMFGVDFLYRMKTDSGSFCRSVSAPGSGKLAKDRVIGAESKGYIIKKNKDQSFIGGSNEDNWRTYQVSYRSGGGLAIASLALASTFDSTGEYTAAQYLKAAEDAFAFLEQHNNEMTNDGINNIVDDYCALMAATELYKATKKEVYKKAADARASALMNRLQQGNNYKNYWRADDKDRPFFHAADAGLPVVSLLNFYSIADASQQLQIKKAVKASMEYELNITGEVNNPFGYSRQLVQDTSNKRYSSFFFPHGTETAPWWQGENARLGSMAAAARMAAHLFADDKPFYDSIESFATDQLNWILGLNPFDACMLEGSGRNNVEYGFFGTFEYTNAPGGIVNGITSGLNDEHDIDLNLSYTQTGKDYDWRWSEQWLPHATWYLLAVALH